MSLKRMGLKVFFGPFFSLVYRMLLFLLDFLQNQDRGDTILNIFGK